MAQLLGLSQEQVAHIRPFFGQKRDGKRVDDRKVLSGITHDGTRKGSAPSGCLCCRWPPHPPYNRSRRWSDKEVFDLIFSELSAVSPQQGGNLNPA